MLYLNNIDNDLFFIEDTDDNVIMINYLIL